MSETPARFRLLPWLVIALYLAIALFTVLDYGVSWDEKVQAAYGEMVVDYYLSGGELRVYETFSNLRYYGPAFEMLPAIAYRSFPYWKFETRHIFIVLAAAVGLMGVVKIGQRFEAGPLLASFAALSLLLMPAYYGHTFFNSKDIPFASAFTWSIYLLLRMVERPGWKTLLPAGIAGGIALGIRVGGVLVFALVLLAVIIQAAAKRESLRTAFRKVTWLVGAGLLAWVIMVLLWPWAQANPIAHPLEALRSSTSFAEVYDVRFAGKVWPSNALPARYLTQMLLVTTPLPILTFVVAGIALAIQRVRKRLDAFPYLLLLCWLFVPLLLQIALRSPLYDGTRHFLFLFPALAMLSAIGGAHLVQLAGNHRLAALSVLVALMTVVPAMVQLHPFQYVYYNQFAGGPAGAADDYELDYWSTSYREAALWVQDHLCGEKTSLLIGANTFNEPTATYFLPRSVKVTTVFQYGIPGKLPPEYDYYAGLRRQQMDENFPDTPIIHRIERMGATLTAIRGGCR